jgi:ferritin-like metal-binding protein YciE
MSMSSWFSKMTGTAMSLSHLDNVLLLQLRDLYSAERQLVDALPEMVKAASSFELKNAFQNHLDETRDQVRRLERAFFILGQDPGGETCEAMQGLISEANEIIGLDGEPAVKDAALIAAAQRVEHYEIAGYGCARAFARRLGLNDIASLLLETMDEESNADSILTDIAENVVNYEAAQR